MKPQSGDPLVHRPGKAYNGPQQNPNESQQQLNGPQVQSVDTQKQPNNSKQQPNHSLSTAFDQSKQPSNKQDQQQNQPSYIPHIQQNTPEQQPNQPSYEHFGQPSIGRIPKPHHSIRGPNPQPWQKPVTPGLMCGGTICFPGLSASEPGYTSGENKQKPSCTSSYCSGGSQKQPGPPSNVPQPEQSPYELQSGKPSSNSNQNEPPNDPKPEKPSKDSYPNQPPSGLHLKKPSIKGFLGTPENEPSNQPNIDKPTNEPHLGPSLNEPHQGETSEKPKSSHPSNEPQHNNEPSSVKPEQPHNGPKNPQGPPNSPILMCLDTGCFPISLPGGLNKSPTDYIQPSPVNSGCSSPNCQGGPGPQSGEKPQAKPGCNSPSCSSLPRPQSEEKRPNKSGCTSSSCPGFLPANKPESKPICTYGNCGSQQPSNNQPPINKSGQKYKGPFPGPDGSIYQSRPADSTPHKPSVSESNNERKPQDYPGMFTCSN